MKISRLAVLLVFLSLCFGFPPAVLAEDKNEKKEFLTVEELMKTEAGQFYLTRRFDQALEKFRELSRQYPKDIVIKRYIAASLDHLRRDQEALEAFNDVLKINNADLPSRQFLGKIYLRMGDLDKAEEQFVFLAEHDKQGTFGLAAKAQLETIKELKKAQQKEAQAPGRKMTAQQFLQTPAAKLFMKAKYPEALSELEKMEQATPDDILIKRYRGLALDKMRKFDEAIAAYDSALALVPNSISLHYAKAQTLLHKQDLDGASKEYQYVIDHDESGVYKARAKAELKGIEQLKEAIRRAKPRKWSVNASSGAEWDSNPTSKSRLRSFAPARGASAWKFSSSAGGNYEFLRKGAWSAKANYNYSHALYSNALNSLNTISNGAGVTLTYIRMVRGKALITQLGHTTTHTMVEEEYYNTSFAQSLTMIYSFTEWYRAIFSQRLTWSTYNREGTNPDQTSRDGFGEVSSLTSNFYLNKAKTFYIPLTLELGHDQPQGRNNIKTYQSYRAGLHFLLPFKVDTDVSYKFKDSNFPKYGSPNTPTARRDDENSLGVTLSRQLTAHWNLSANYNYTSAESRDGNYTYTNHALGFTLSFYY